MLQDDLYQKLDIAFVYGTDLEPHHLMCKVHTPCIQSATVAWLFIRTL